MKNYAITLTLALCAAGIAQAADKGSVKGSGCVEKAAEHSCRVIIDSRTGELYNLSFNGDAPKAGTAIQFSGTPHKNAGTCSTGKPVKVSKWKKEAGIKCPPPVIAQVGR